MRPVVLGQVRHDPHLDLAVVGGQQRLVALADDERRADAAALVGADRDVLQVGVRATTSRPVAATVWLNVVWMRPSSDDRRRADPSTVWRSFDDVAVAQQLLEAAGARSVRTASASAVGVGGVAGLGLLGLRQPQLVEEDLLQLLGRAEVERPRRPARARPSRRRACARRTRTRGPRGASTSTAMPACSRSASTCSSGSSTSRRSDVPPRASSSASSTSRGRARARPASPERRRLRRPRRRCRTRAGAAPASPPPQLALEVARDEVVEVEGALTGQHEVRRERGVAGEAAQRPAARADARAPAPSRRARLGPVAVGEPGRERLLVVGAAARRRVDVAPPRRPATATATPPTMSPVPRPHVAARTRHRCARRPARAPSSQGPMPAPRISTRRPTTSLPRRRRRVVGGSANSRSRSTRNSSASKTVCTASRSQGRRSRSVAVDGQRRRRGPAR